MSYYIDTTIEFVRYSLTFRIAALLAAVSTVPFYFMSSALNFAV